MLGPKMYNAEATLQDDNHHGSTRLHLDLTDAVNVMIWAANLDEESGESGYAVWHIFAASDLPCLRQFLTEEGIFKGMGDSVHSQTICMTPALLQRLFDKYGVRPYVINQYVGHAVYIPAECAHQVRFRIIK
jgi:hypothetical protein